MVRQVVAFTALAALLSACAAPHGKPGQTGGPLPKWSLPDLDGKKVASSAYSGKPLYVNLFATWCGPCVEEAPDINALSKKYAPQGLQVVGVDEIESAAKAKAFVQRFGLSYPTLLDDGTLEDAFLVNGLPVHVFVARNGIIRQIHRGQMDKAQIESAIRSIL